jgi:hypothetical protein
MINLDQMNYKTLILYLVILQVKMFVLISTIQIESVCGIIQKK